LLFQSIVHKIQDNDYFEGFVIVLRDFHEIAVNKVVCQLFA